MSVPESHLQCYIGPKGQIGISCYQVNIIYTPAKQDLGSTLCRISRVLHGYGFTHGASKTGTAGTGTVLDFSTPWHTMYPYHGIVGISQVR
jgi:hypothetical protein